MTLDRPQLQTRPPSGKVPAPFILLEGEEKAGKTWQAILLSASEKVGATYFLDLGEGTADEYGAIPGARFEVLVHDGTYASVLEQVLAVKAAARQAQADGLPPVVLIIDTMSDEWDGLRAWANERAKLKPANQKKLREDPAAELDVSRNIWNDVDTRHSRLMNALLTFPGIVVGTARGKVISATDPTTGQPYRDGRKDYRVEGHKQLAYQATVWVRLTRNGLPEIVGARSVHAGVKPGSDKPRVVENPPDNLLEWLVFDVLKYEPGVGAVRDFRNMRGGDLTADERADEQVEEARNQKAAAARQRRQEPGQELPATPPVPDPGPSAETPEEAAEREVSVRQATRAHNHAKRKGPARNQEMARAWDALLEVVPDWTREERTAETTRVLAELGTTPADAPAEAWIRLAEKWEEEADDAIRARHAAGRG